MTMKQKKNNKFIKSLPADNLLSVVGVGLRTKHYDEILNKPDNIGWLEVHPENYFGGGINLYYLEKARELYEISFHGVGLSLGSDKLVCKNHLTQIKELIDRFEPFSFSEHLSWSASGNAHLNDLLPLPYNKEVVNRLCSNINYVQDFLNMEILIENPSTYISFGENEMKEWEVINELSSKTGCKILLDINNIYVQSQNHGFSQFDYIDNINHDNIYELHLAGYSEFSFPDKKQKILIDTHSKKVHDPVWELFSYAMKKFGCTIPTLIEWDDDIPSLDILSAEAAKAEKIIINKSCP